MKNNEIIADINSRIDIEVEINELNIDSKNAAYIEPIINQIIWLINNYWQQIHACLLR